MSEPCALAILTNYNKLMTPGRQPSSTVSWNNWTSTLLPYRRLDSLPTAASENRATCSSSRERSLRSLEFTALDLQWGTPCCPQLSRLLEVHPESSLFASLPLQAQSISWASIYAPTLCSSAEIKDEFYEELETTIKEVLTAEHLFLLRDFNARIGDDHNSWPRCIGHFGIGKLNENGQRLLELCSYHDLCISNTFFSTKSCHRESWRHPRSCHWHQLDLVITRRPLLNYVLTTRSYHSADSDTDHSLVGSKVRLYPKRLYNSKQKGRPRINTALTSVQKFAHALPVPSKRPLRTAQTTALKRDGATFVTPSTTRPWQPLASGWRKIQTGLKQE